MVGVPLPLDLALRGSVMYSALDDVDITGFAVSVVTEHELAAVAGLSVFGGIGFTAVESEYDTGTTDNNELAFAVGLA